MAILTLVHMDQVPERLVPEEGETGFEFAARQAERANLPANQQAITSILNYIETADLDHLPKPLDVSLLGNVVKVAVSSGSPAHLSQLMKLAHHPDRRIRHAVADPNGAYMYLPDPPMELLKECLIVAEKKLPKDLKDKQAAKAAFDEFEWRVDVFTRYARTQSKRDEARPFVERFYKRYGWWETRKYKPEFTRQLNGIPLIAERSDLKKFAAEVARQKMRKAVITVAAILAVLAMLWWLIRRRMRKASAS